MLQANLVTTYLLMQGAAAAPLRAGLSPAAQSFPQFSAGQALGALIVSQVGPGLYLADVDGQHLQLNMPMPVTPGERVSLRVLRTNPALVFDLIRADPFPLKTRTSLSEAAQSIRSALTDGPQAAVTAAPLVAEHAEAQDIALALRQAVAKSGVFYESHLVAWVAGKRTLAELRDEPQSLWSTRGAATAGLDDARGPLQEGAIPDAAKPLLRQQLDALEMNRIVWSGPIWPGQSASLTVQEHAPYVGASPAETTWRTTLSLQLPRLGDVQAALTLRDSVLSVSIDCGDGQGADEMGGSLNQLRSRIEAVGLALTDIRISQHETR